MLKDAQLSVAVSVVCWTVSVLPFWMAVAAPVVTNFVANGFVPQTTPAHGTGSWVGPAARASLAHICNIALTKALTVSRLIVGSAILDLVIISPRWVRNPGAAETERG